MTELHRLIKELCPDGVEYKTLEDCLDYEQPTKYIVKSTNYNDAYETPVLTAGQSFILGYTNETDGIYKADKENPVIIFDDFTTSFHWVDFDFKVKSSAMKMLKPKNNIYFRYVFYAMECIKFKPYSHMRYWISSYSKFEIPFPPLEIQQKIVNILDNFTEIIELLKRETELRQKQYEYYRNKLLTFGDDISDGVEYKKLCEIATVSRGIRVVKKQLETTGNIPVYQNSMTPLGYYKKSNCKSNTTFVIGAGSAGEIGFSSVEFWAADDCYYFVCSEKILDRFLYYALFCRYNFIKSQVRKASIPRLERFVIENLKVPVPPIEVQREIVNILDNFTEIIELSKRETELRQKQYKYYRDKLLNFKEKQ